jgi:lipoprotein-anchoring transpeptidase ErfK/SrfK
MALSNPNRRGTPLVLLVRRRRGRWLNVYLPVRPNSSRGWIRARDARVLKDLYRVVVRVRRHRLEVWRRHRLVTRQTVAVGRRRMPTPRGVFFVVELLKPTRANGPYGPYSFGLSAHSNVLRRFGGGDGRIGMHGTDTPRLLGHSISHGCIRMRNRAVRKLARMLPLGTPVLIRR